MTFSTSGNVTNAGWRRVQEQPRPWNCPNGCSHEPVRRYLTHCPHCKTERPK